jgi:hypothetical protein
MGLVSKVRYENVEAVTGKDLVVVDALERKVEKMPTKEEKVHLSSDITRY